MLTVNATLEAELVAPPEGKPGEANFVHPPFLQSLVVRRLSGGLTEDGVAARILIQDAASGMLDRVDLLGPGPRLFVIRIVKADPTFHFISRALELATSAAVANILMVNAGEGGRSRDSELTVVLTGQSEAVVDLRDHFGARRLPVSSARICSAVNRLDQVAGQAPAPRFVLRGPSLRVAAMSTLRMIRSKLQAQRTSEWTGHEEFFLVEHRLRWLHYIEPELEGILEEVPEPRGGMRIRVRRRSGADVRR
jgi:hypothetical protein